MDHKGGSLTMIKQPTINYPEYHWYHLILNQLTVTWPQYKVERRFECKGLCWRYFKQFQNMYFCSLNICYLCFFCFCLHFIFLVTIFCHVRFHLLRQSLVLSIGGLFVVREPLVGILPLLLPLPPVGILCSHIHDLHSVVIFTLGLCSLYEMSAYVGCMLDPLKKLE